MDDDPESALVAELRALAGPGAAAGSAFFVVHDALRIAVSYSSGSSSSLTLAARYDDVAQPSRPVARAAPHGYRDAPSLTLRATRPLDLTLRPEGAGDVAAKRKGVSVEWQSGDEAFDAGVYVETPSTDAAVIGAVLNAEVRAAVRALLALGFLSVRIDDGRGEVSTTLVEFAPRRSGRGRRAVEAFAGLLANLPAVTHTGARAPTPLAGWTRFLGVVGVAGWSTNIGWGVGVTAIFEEISPPPRGATDSPSAVSVAASVGIGIVAGVIASRTYGARVQARTLGRSDAHTLAATARLSSFGGVSVLVFTAALIAALALERG
jgi:hypothetical protein